MNERKNEKQFEYHNRQWKNPYRSTEVFVDWLENKGFLNRNEKLKICDMACGGGANSQYIATRYVNCTVTGIDISEDIVQFGNEMLEQSQIKNCKLFQGDWYNIDPKWINQFDGIVSFQALLMMPEYKESLKNLTKLNPRWIAISSLFYEGEIDYTIKLKDYYRVSDGKEYWEFYYNIYSIPHVRKYLKDLGYSKFEFMPFEIDRDLPKPDNMDIGTYTVKTESGNRIQISAAMMMPWYFIIASK